MKLIGSLTSPYVRKVRVVLAEKNSERKNDWKAKCLSYAQKPWSKEERERIHDAGGKLNRIYGETRLGEIARLFFCGL